MNNNTKKITICALAIAINIVFGTAVSWLSIPFLFLDMMGTIFVSAKIGMKEGILVGLCTNLVLGVLTSPTSIPFALVSIVCAIIVALMAKNGFGYKTALITGIILGIVSPIIGTPIRILLFGGLTGSGTDLIISAFVASGKDIFSSVFISTVMANMIDKIISCIIISKVMQSTEKNI